MWNDSSPGESKNEYMYHNGQMSDVYMSQIMALLNIVCIVLHLY